ncbi:hypothetical protein OTK49_28325 [Vibrio coralliirubri]|uniref:hypothetical protein n=1 Tax=Vibrio coralliirubri TaxID=1516159 RepID=UPI002283DD22|nr:hypothetical protein [Vibrio coralliirubri]MCY9866450.1 hypothetical protein [Vibrio coralliirubri]
MTKPASQPDSTLSEQYVSCLPISVITDVFHWLQENKKLDDTDFELSIKTAICLGDRPDLEEAFPEFAGYNPVYSFRRFNILFNTIEPTESHRGWIEIELQELEESGKPSPLIYKVNGCLNHLLLHHPKVIELLHEQSAILRKQENGFIRYGVKLPKRKLSISISTTSIEEVFVSQEVHYQIRLPRPYYMKLVCPKGAEVLPKPDNR